MTQNYKICPKCNNALDNNVMQCPYCGENLQINIGYEKISGNTIINKTTLNQKKSKGCLIFFIIFFIIPFIGSTISLIIGLISSLFQ